MKYYAIFTSTGEHDDFSEECRFLVENEEDAKTLVDKVNSAIEFLDSFNRNEFRNFLSKYMIDNPPPPMADSQFKFGEPQPQLPVHLQKMSKRERNGTSMYNAYLKDYAEWDKRRLAAKAIHKCECDEYLSAWLQWNSNKALAEKEFRKSFNDKLIEMLGEHVSLVYADNCTYLELEVKSVKLGER